MFTILKRDKNDQLTEVAVADTREQAERLLERMRRLFPGDKYELRDSEPTCNGSRQPGEDLSGAFAAHALVA